LAGRVKLGVFPAAMAVLAPRALALLRSEHPGLAVSLSEAATPSLLRQLRAGRLSVAVVGVGAGELIAEGVLAVEMCALASDVAMTIHPHPTLSETVMNSAEVFYGTSTDVYRPKRG